jgi:hypothetical protein
MGVVTMSADQHKWRAVGRGLARAGIVLIVVIGSASAVAQTAYKTFMCERDGQQRRISLESIVLGSSDCHVRYQKLTELFDHDEILWRGSRSTQFCLGKANELMSKLGGWRWTCRAENDLTNWPDGLLQVSEALLTDERSRTARMMTQIEPGRNPRVHANVVKPSLLLADIDADGHRDAAFIYVVVVRGRGIRSYVAAARGSEDGRFDLVGSVGLSLYGAAAKVSLEHEGTTICVRARTEDRGRHIPACLSRFDIDGGRLARVE